jgi:hypothetical protein
VRGQDWTAGGVGLRSPESSVMKAGAEC